MELAPQALIGEPTYAWDGNGVGVGVGVGGSFEDSSNVETTPSTPTSVLLQSPPFLLLCKYTFSRERGSHNVSFIVPPQDAELFVWDKRTEASHAMRNAHVHKGRK